MMPSVILLSLSLLLLLAPAEAKQACEQIGDALACPALTIPDRYTFPRGAKVFLNSGTCDVQELLAASQEWETVTRPPSMTVYPGTVTGNLSPLSILDRRTPLQRFRDDATEQVQRLHDRLAAEERWRRAVEACR